MVGIYKIINKINGKIYVGQSVNIEERWKQHEYKAFNANGQAYNSAIHQAFRKYGVENFEYQVIELCSVEELDEKEIYWIEKLDTLAPNGYNILPGGQKTRASTRILYCKKCGKEICRDNGSGLCRSCVQIKSDISKEELYQALLDNKGNFTKVGAIYGITDNAVRKKCKNYGLPHLSSDYKSIKTKINPKRPVQSLNMITGEIVSTYESIADAARDLGIAKGNHITEACQGKIKSAYGFRWQYI